MLLGQLGGQPARLAPGLLVCRHAVQELSDNICACRFCKEMNAWVGDFHLGKDIIEAALGSMQACSLLLVQRKRLYSLPDFAAAQQAHQAKASCLLGTRMMIAVYTLNLHSPPSATHCVLGQPGCKARHVLLAARAAVLLLRQQRLT